MAVSISVSTYGGLERLNSRSNLFWVNVRCAGGQVHHNSLSHIPIASFPYITWRGRYSHHPTAYRVIANMAPYYVASIFKNTISS